MALASYFNKTLLAAEQLLRGLDPGALKGLLEGKSVAIAFDDCAATVPEGRYIAELSVNLAARLYPRLALVPVGECAVKLGDELRAFAVQINPLLDFVDLNSADAIISVGQREWREASVPCVYAGSAGWRAEVSHVSPRTLAAGGNPFGAGAAACLAAAQVFRTLFAEHFLAPTREEVSLSLWNYDVNKVDQTAASASAHLDSVVLVGAGAIGNGVLWALKHSGSTGTIIVVDPETVEEGNLQRYILADSDSIGRSKVEIAKDRLAACGLTVVPVMETWARFATTRHPLGFELVATALDTAQARCEVQASLPRRIVNAWTQTGDLGVSRHEFLGDQACLACLYLPSRVEKNEDEIIAEAFGLDAKQGSSSLMEIRNALYFGSAMDQNWIAKVATALNVQPEELMPFVGKPLRTIYQEAICGGQIINTNRGRVEVPMAFQSALAGIMLAAEIVKERQGYVAELVTTKLNLMRPLGTFLSEKQEKSRFRNCICQDRDFVVAYESKFKSR